VLAFKQPIIFTPRLNVMKSDVNSVRTFTELAECVQILNWKVVECRKLVLKSALTLPCPVSVTMQASKIGQDDVKMKILKVIDHLKYFKFLNPSILWIRMCNYFATVNTKHSVPIADISHILGSEFFQ